MLARILTVVLALAFTIAVLVPFYLMMVLPIASWRSAAELFYALAALAVSIYVVSRFGGWPAALLFIGTIGLAVACTYQAFLDYSIRYGWEGAFVFQGDFGLRENPFLKIPAQLAGYVAEVFVPAGIVCCAARWIHNHLTRRCT